MPSLYHQLIYFLDEEIKTKELVESEISPSLFDPKAFKKLMLFNSFCILGKTHNLKSGDLVSIPLSAFNQLTDLGQISLPNWPLFPYPTNELMTGDPLEPNDFMIVVFGFRVREIQSFFFHVS